VSAIGRAVDGEVRRHGFHVLRELCGHGTGRTLWEEPSVPNVEVPGREVLTEGRRRRVAVLAAALDGLSPADRAALAGGLDALEKLLGHP